MSTELVVLTVEQRVLAEFDEKEEELRELAASTTTITAITNPDGYQQCHSARMVLKNRRIEIDKRGKKVRDEAVKFSKGVISQADKFIALIEPEETRLEKLQKEWDDAREAEKEARIQAEVKRVADLQDRVAELRGCPNLSASSGSALIADHISDLEALPADESLQEFQQAGADAKVAGLARLRELHAAALAHETEQTRIKAEREELAKLRQAEQERQAAERARIVEEERVARVARDAEAARQAAELRKEREAQAAETARQRAEQEAAAKVERERIAAEERRLADERAALAREQEALRKAQEPPPAPPPAPPAPVSRRGVAVPVPKANEIIDVLAKHYRARPDTIIEWLRAIDWARAEAA